MNETGSASQSSPKNIKMKTTSNKKTRTFIISVNGAKYKTCLLSKEEFEEMSFNTDKDWMAFLKNSSNYQKIQK